MNDFITYLVGGEFERDCFAFFDRHANIIILICTIFATWCFATGKPIW